MPKSTKAYVDKHVLVSADLPAQTETYTVISHEYIINTTLQNLADAGFVVKEEKYRCNQGAQIATGIYNINYGNDPDLSMVFAWTNSYDKSTRFRCAIGANVNASGASIVKKTSAWTRKHTGAALDETTTTIQAIIADADTYYSELVDIKNKMKHIPVSLTAKELEEKMNYHMNQSEYFKDQGDEEQGGLEMDIANSLSKSYTEESKKGFGHVMGDLYFTKRLLNGDQASICMRESDTPSFHYGTGVNSLWTVYNYILCSLKITHPKLWMDTQMSVLLHFMDEYDLVNFDVEEDESAVIDTPEITGIPDGNAMSDTDDNEDVTPPVVDVTAEDDGRLVPEYEEEVSMRAEDLQSVPADNAEEATEAVACATPDPVDNRPTTYIHAVDYPGAEVGQFVEVEGTVFEIKTEIEADGEKYFGLEEYNSNLDEAAEKVEAEVEENTNVLPTAPLPEPVTEMGPIDEVVEDIIPNTDSVPADTGFDLDNSEPENTSDESDDTDLPLFTVIKKELQDLYGSVLDFKVDRQDDQYNITLDSGETIVLSTSYIDGLLEE